jgi:phosphoglycerol transferase MdoB-like AlkP superfamily enzyme
MLQRFSAPPRLLRWVAALFLGWLAALTLMRVATYLFFHDRMDWAQAAPALTLGLRFDVRVLAAVALGFLVLGLVPGLGPWGGGWRRRSWLGLVAAVSVALAIVYAADWLHYRYLGERLNATVLGYAKDAGISAGMAWESYPLVRIALAIAAVGAAFTGLGARLLRWAEGAAPGGGRWAQAGWVAGAAGLAAVGIFGRLGQYPLRWSDAFDLRSDAAANLALNPIQSFASSLSFRGSGYDEARVRALYPEMSRYLGVAAPEPTTLRFARETPANPAGAPLARAGGEAPPNVVLVICESFSGYKSSMWGNPLDTTPFFAELARGGVFFDNCFTPHIGTARGVWATITGLPDVEPKETASRNPALVDQHTILNEFTGHAKFYFIGGSTSWANIRGLLTNNIHGLQLYEEGKFNSPRNDVWGIGDRRLFLEAHEILKAQTKPFFAVIQTADNHRPYTIPKRDLEEFQPKTLSAAELKRGGFESLEEFNAFRYSDFVFRKFIEQARTAPYFDRTLFVFIGDHGIGGDAGTMFPRAWTDQKLTCYHVPLLFYAPKLLAPQRIGSVASMVDVLPTIAGLLGVPYRNQALGRDLLRQQTIDGGRSNAAFVIDHHSRTVGLVRGSHLSQHGLDGGRAETVWADFRTPEPGGALTEAQIAEKRRLAESFYETARYLLRHNRKPAPAAAPRSE